MVSRSPTFRFRPAQRLRHGHRADRGVDVRDRACKGDDPVSADVVSVKAIRMISPLIFFSCVIVVGIAAILIGRTMNTHAEEEWKGEYWWREFIMGPPGYHRASMIVVGFVFILV